jgi:excisionase family DNA binding protein
MKSKHMTNILVATVTKEELAQIINDAVKALIPKNRSADSLNVTWLSRAEAARHLKVSLPTLDDLTKEGKLTAHRIGRSKKYELNEINQQIKNLKIKYK